ncbi:hypothetical protein OKW49_006972 [Paraburkholderia youngii]
MDSVRAASVSLRIEGADDGFILEGVSHMREISRDPEELVAQTAGQHHQYPDGFMLFLGTMFSPIKDRHAPGSGFTHHLGHKVTIATPELGALVNTVQSSTENDQVLDGTATGSICTHRARGCGECADGRAPGAAAASSPGSADRSRLKVSARKNAHARLSNPVAAI